MPATAAPRERGTGERAVDAAKAAIATIGRHQETKYSPRVAVAGTLIGIDLGFPPTQHPPPLTSEQLSKAARYTLSDFFAGCGGSSLGALWAGIGS